MAIALLSFSFINLLNNNTDDFKMNILFAAFFAFSMTVMIGAMWEIIEFASDSWFNTNMQRAYVSTLNGRGDPLIGQAALNDTMKDIILDSIGAAAMCIICAVAMCKKKIKLSDLSFIKRHNKVVATNSENIETHNELTLMTSDDEDCQTLHLLDEIENCEIVENKETVVDEEQKIQLEKPIEKNSKSKTASAKKSTKKQPVKKSSKN
jgi:hypothetical protein